MKQQRRVKVKAYSRSVAARPQRRMADGGPLDAFVQRPTGTADPRAAGAGPGYAPTNAAPALGAMMSQGQPGDGPLVVGQRGGYGPYGSAQEEQAARARSAAETALHDARWRGSSRREIGALQQALAGVDNQPAAVAAPGGAKPTQPALGAAQRDAARWDLGVTKRGQALADFRAGKISADQLGTIDTGLDSALAGLGGAPMAPPGLSASLLPGLSSGLGLVSESDDGMADGGPVGLLAPGNIDLHARPIVHNPDGSISTVRASSYNIDGRETLLPTISPDGKNWTAQEAVDNFRKTGQHLGQFDTPENATTYAKRLHEDQAREYLPKAGQTGVPGLASGGPAWNARHGGPVPTARRPGVDQVPAMLDAPPRGPAEYVLPGDTAQQMDAAMGGTGRAPYPALERVRRATHDPAKVAARRAAGSGKRTGRKMGDGGPIDRMDLEQRARAAQVAGQPVPRDPLRLKAARVAGVPVEQAALRTPPARTGPLSAEERARVDRMVQGLADGGSGYDPNAEDAYRRTVYFASEPGVLGGEQFGLTPTTAARPAPPDDLQRRRPWDPVSPAPMPAATPDFAPAPVTRFTNQLQSEGRQAVERVMAARESEAPVAPPLPRRGAMYGVAPEQNEPAAPPITGYGPGGALRPPEPISVPAPRGPRTKYSFFGPSPTEPGKIRIGLFPIPAAGEAPTADVEASKTPMSPGLADRVIAPDTKYPGPQASPMLNPEQARGGYSPMPNAPTLAQRVFNAAQESGIGDDGAASTMGVEPSVLRRGQPIPGFVAALRAGRDPEAGLTSSDRQYVNQLRAAGGAMLVGPDGTFQGYEMPQNRAVSAADLGRQVALADAADPRGAEARRAAALSPENIAKVTAPGYKTSGAGMFDPRKTLPAVQAEGQLAQAQQWFGMPADQRGALPNLVADRMGVAREMPSAPPSVEQQRLALDEARMRGELGDKRAQRALDARMKAAELGVGVSKDDAAAAQTEQEALRDLVTGKAGGKQAGGDGLGAPAAPAWSPAQQTWVLRYGGQMLGLPQWRAGYGANGVYGLIAPAARLVVDPEMALQRLMTAAGVKTPTPELEAQAQQQYAQSLRAAQEAMAGILTQTGASR